MRRTRPMKPGSEFYLPPQEFRLAVAFCMNYSEYFRKLKELDGQRGIFYDGMPHGNTTGDPTATIAIMRQKIQSKIDLIENTTKEVGEGLYDWLLLGITTDVSYQQLSNELGMPCSNKLYSRKVREIYFKIAKEI